MKYDHEYITYLPMALVVMDENMDLRSATRDAFSMFGVRLHPHSHQACLAMLAAKLMETPDLIQLVGASTLRLQHPGSRDTLRWEDGNRCFNIVVFTLPTEDGQLEYGIHFTDVSDQIRFEQDRETMRNCLEQILNSLPLGIVVVDRDLLITAMNTAQQAILRDAGAQVSLLQAVGMNVTEFFPPTCDPSWNRVRDEVLGKGSILHGLLEQRSKSGSDHIYSITIAPLRDDAELITGAIRISQDITAQTKAEAEARKAEVLSHRLTTVQQLAVTLSDEVNNALAVIMMNTDLIRKQAGPQIETGSERFDAIACQVKRISEFIRRLAGIKEVKTVEYFKGSGTTMISVEDPES